MSDRGVLATFLMSPLSKITNLENSTQFKLVKDSSSNRVKDLLIKNTIPVTLHDKLLRFRDKGRVFELKGDLLKMITNKNYKVDLTSLASKKLRYDFAKESHFYVRRQTRKSTRDRTLINLLKSPGLMVSASGISNKIFLASDFHELCNRLKLLLQEERAGNISDLNNEEIVFIIDKSLEYKCLSKEQHKQVLIKCNLLHEEN